LNIKRLAVFGDSWVYGDELVDPQHPEWECCFTQNDDYRLSHSFSGLIAKELGVPYENYGHPGASLQSTIWTFLWFLENTDWTDTLCLVGLTGTDRQTWYNPDHVSYSNDPAWNKYIHSTWVNFGSSVIPEEWQKFGKQYLTLSHCDELSKLNYQQAVYFFDGISKTKNIPLLQFNLYNPHTELEADTLLWPRSNFREELLAKPNKKEIHAPNDHPNEIGHEIISKKLLSKINDVILT
jgi:hypothetical protein